MQAPNASANTGALWSLEINTLTTVDTLDGTHESLTQTDAIGSGVASLPGILLMHIMIVGRLE